jgi:hypothetical protein
MASEQLATSVPEQNNNGPTASKSSSSSSSSSDSDSSSSGNIFLSTCFALCIGYG